MARNDIKIGSNKSFGIVFFVVFLLIAIYPLLKDESIRIWSLILAFIFLILGLRNSNLLSPLNSLWFKFGIFLSRLISPLVMLIVFFFVVTPLAILARIIKKDFLIIDKKKNMKKKTYWLDKEKYDNSMKDQF